MSWQMITAAVLGLGTAVIGTGISVLVLAGFNDSTTNGQAETVFGNGITMFTNFTGQLATVGTIAGVLLLVGLVALVGIAGYRYSR